MGTLWIQVSNNGTTTLAANMTDSDATLEVASVANLPSTYPFRLTIWDAATYGDQNPNLDPNMEVVEVTAEGDYYGDQDYGYSTTVYQITRAQEGTSAAAHSSGDACCNHLTAAVIAQMQAAITALEDA